MHVQAPVASAMPVVNQQAPADVVDVVRKRQLEREDVLFEMEMEERRLEMAERRQKLLQLTAETSMKAAEAQMKATEVQMKVMDVQKRLRDEYTLLCPNQVMDDRVRLQFKDNLLNIASSSTPARMQAAIGDGSDTGSAAVLSVGNATNASNGTVATTAVNPNKFITISTLAAEMGHRFDSEALKKIGMNAAAAYKIKYGGKPGKHEQLVVGGATRPVNSYTERDRAMVEKAIVDFING
jgi:hypothetical protein